MSSNWYRTRTIDLLMGSLSDDIWEAVLAGVLAAIAAVVSVFQPIIAITESLQSGTAPRLSPYVGYPMVLMAFVSVILSLKGFLRARTKRLAWGAICALGVAALVLASLSVFAEHWLLRVHISQIMNE